MQSEPRSDTYDEVSGADTTGGEIGRYLSVQSAQIEASSRFAERPIGGVIECLSEIMAKAKGIQGAIPAEDTDAHLARQSILELCNQAIEGLQFSDELTQRLEHVSRSLSDLTMHVTMCGENYNEVDWQVIEKHMQTRYSTEAERDIHARGYSEDSAKE